MIEGASLYKTIQSPCGRWTCPPLVAGATTFPPLWEACHWILSRLRLLANPVPLPPQFGGAAKGKRLNGQARRLTSPHLEVLCRTSTGDYKAPRSHVLISRSTLSTGCSAPVCGGSPAQPERGEASAASQSAKCLSYHMTQKGKSVTLTL